MDYNAYFNPYWRNLMLKTITMEPIQPEKAMPVFPDSNKDSPANSRCHLWDTKEVAAFLNVKESTIRNWVHIGYIPHIKFRGAVRFQKLAITDWIEGCTVSNALPDARKVSSDILRSRYSRA